VHGRRGLTARGWSSGDGGRALTGSDVIAPDERVATDDEVCFAAGRLDDERHHLTAVKVLRPDSIHLHATHAADASHSPHVYTDTDTLLAYILRES